MGLFEGKKGLILGVANGNSIAWSIASEIMSGGGCAVFPICPTDPMTSGSGIADGWPC